MRTILALILGLLAAPAPADEAEDAFVTANLLSILYHQLGHALIDTVAPPVSGPPEEAADVASILLINAIFEEDAAQDIAYHSAFGFMAAATAAKEGAQAPAYWAEHGADERRFYDLVCLFYGAAPEDRADIAAEMGLPAARAETCPDAFRRADESWGRVWEQLSDAETGEKLRFAGQGGGPAASLIHDEIRALNESFTFPAPLTVAVQSCGRADAFYDPAARAITLCTEFAPHLRALYARLK